MTQTGPEVMDLVDDLARRRDVARIQLLDIAAQHARQDDVDEPNATDTPSRPQA